MSNAATSGRINPCMAVLSRDARRRPCGPFVGPVPEMDALTINVNFDDGYVAYLNGVEVASNNADLKIKSWRYEAPFISVAIHGQNIQGQTGTVSIKGFSKGQ